MKYFTTIKRDRFMLFPMITIIFSGTIGIMLTDNLTENMFLIILFVPLLASLFLASHLEYRHEVKQKRRSELK